MLLYVHTMIFSMTSYIFTENKIVSCGVYFYSLSSSSSLLLTVSSQTILFMPPCFPNGMCESGQQTVLFLESPVCWAAASLQANSQGAP